MMHSQPKAISGPFAWAACRTPDPKPTRLHVEAAGRIRMDFNLGPDAVSEFGLAEGVMLYGESQVRADLEASLSYIWPGPV